MFEITKIKVDSKNNGSDEIFVEFIVNGSDVDNLKVVIEERIFRTSTCEIQPFSVKTGCQYWISCTTIGIGSVNNGSGQLTSKFNNGFFVKFYNGENLLYEYEYKYLKTNLERLQLRPAFYKKTIWVVGDSHVAHIFKNIKHEDINFGDFVFNHESVVALSLNRFLNSDYEEFLRTIPIKKDDVVCFLLGEIDLRKGIIHTSRTKNKNMNYLLYSLVHRYVEFYSSFTKKFRNTFLLSPNGIVLEGHVESFYLDHFTEDSEQDRIFLWNEFHSLLTEMLGQRYIDFTKSIRRDDNSINFSFLKNDDHHLKSDKKYFEIIYEQVKKNYIP